MNTSERPWLTRILDTSRSGDRCAFSAGSGQSGSFGYAKNLLHTARCTRPTSCPSRKMTPGWIAQGAVGGAKNLRFVTQCPQFNCPQDPDLHLERHNFTRSIL